MRQDKKMFSPEDKLYAKIANEMFNANICGEELAHLSPKKSEKLGDTFQRNFKRFVNRDELKLREFYNKTNWRPVGQQDVKIGSKVFQLKDVVGYLNQMEDDPGWKHMVLPKQISMTDIYAYLKTQGKTWKGMKPRERIDLLFGMGLNVKLKEGLEDISRYEQKNGPHRNLQGKPMSGWYIEASERTDKEWLGSGFASDAAILYTTDGSLGRELQQIMNR